MCNNSLDFWLTYNKLYFCSKIKRVIFEGVRKWDGGLERFLSISQVKQIAGRAGRYGLHGDEAPGGFVTTLHAADLPFLKKTIDLPVAPLQFARLGPSRESFADITNALPPSSSTATIYKAHVYVSRLQPMYRYSATAEQDLATMCEFIDTHGRGLTISDRHLLLLAPIPWRDQGCVKIMTNFIQMYRDDMNVDLMEALKDTDYLDTLAQIEEKIASGYPPQGKGPILEKLEMLHKVLVFYLWMSFRNPVSYNCHDEVSDLKKRVEKALDWTLEGVSKLDTMERPHVIAEGNQGNHIMYESKLAVKARRAIV